MKVYQKFCPYCYQKMKRRNVTESGHWKCPSCGERGFTAVLDIELSRKELILCKS